MPLSSYSVNSLWAFFLMLFINFSPNLCVIYLSCTVFHENLGLIPKRVKLKDFIIIPHEIKYLNAYMRKGRRGKCRRRIKVANKETPSDTINRYSSFGLCSQGFPTSLGLSSHISYLSLFPSDQYLQDTSHNH